MPSTLPISYFDDCSEELPKINHLISQKRLRNEYLTADVNKFLIKNNEVTCKTDTVNVLKFDTEKRKFQVVFKDGLKKLVCRSNMKMEYESQYESANRRKTVLEFK